jgi:hypothetical protein
MIDCIILVFSLRRQTRTHPPRHSDSSEAIFTSIPLPERHQPYLVRASSVSDDSQLGLTTMITHVEIYFALASQVRTKDIATKIATSLMEIATDLSFSVTEPTQLTLGLTTDTVSQLESLEIALAEELDSANQCVHALNLLNKFNFISVCGSIESLVGPRLTGP